MSHRRNSHITTDERADADDINLTAELELKLTMPLRLCGQSPEASHIPICPTHVKTWSQRRDSAEMDLPER
jgi:hypothetical protein